MLAKYHPLWMNLHFNHPNEITPEVSRAVDKLTRAGIPLGNQSVLLAGVNDCVHIQRALVHRLVENRDPAVLPLPVRPGRGLRPLPDAGRQGPRDHGRPARPHLAATPCPTYVIDAPGGGGKIPVMPNYLISYSDHKVVLRNYEGYITTYEEPPTYTAARQGDLRVLPEPAPGARPVAASLGLLEGERMWIEPTRLRARPTRAATPRRTGSRTRRKWVPYGVGRDRGIGVSDRSGCCRAARPTASTMARAPQPRPMPASSSSATSSPRNSATATARSASTDRARSPGRARASPPPRPMERCSDRRGQPRGDAPSSGGHAGGPAQPARSCRIRRPVHGPPGGRPGRTARARAPDLAGRHRRPLERDLPGLAVRSSGRRRRARPAPGELALRLPQRERDRPRRGAGRRRP